jgi:hypothetical protein
MDDIQESERRNRSRELPIASQLLSAGTDRHPIGVIIQIIWPMFFIDPTHIHPASSIPTPRTTTTPTPGINVPKTLVPCTKHLISSNNTFFDPD